MGVKTGYKGYKSYDYLEKGVDYRDFKLTKEIGWIEPYVLPLSKDEETRFQRLKKELVVVSVHEHTCVTTENTAELMDYEREGREVCGFEGLSLSCIDAMFDNLMDGTCVIHTKSGWSWDDVIHDIGIRACDIAHQDFLFKGERVEDIHRAHREGKMAWFLALESSTPCENQIDRFEILYGLGVRMMGVCYSESNMLGSGAAEIDDGGLTAFGREAVVRMNKIGMAIDVSHAGDKTSMDTIKLSQKPVFITHAGARTLWNMRRLKPDDVIKACADKGGVIGIEAAPKTTITKKHPVHDLEGFMEHFEYVKDLVGIDYVGFGPDTLYGDHAGFNNLFSKVMSISGTQSTSGTKDTAPAKDAIPQIRYVKGVENPTEAFDNILRWMVKHGYSDEDIAKAIGGNAIRTLKEIWV